MEDDSVLRRKEVLIHATMWMNLEHIMLSERSTKGHKLDDSILDMKYLE